MNELAEQEQVMLNKIHYNITEYLKEFNSDYRFKIILSTTSGGPVMNADPVAGHHANRSGRTEQKIRRGRQNQQKQRKTVARQINRSVRAGKKAIRDAKPFCLPIP